jgi:hypothetical protein
MPVFKDFTKEVQSKFRIRDETSEYVHYPFNQGQIIDYAGINSDGVCRVLSLLFANARFNTPPMSYEDTFGKHRDVVVDFVKRLAAMQKVAENKTFYLPSDVPVGASSVKLKAKSATPLKLNSISDIISEIVSHQAVYYVGLRTADGVSGHAIAFDTRGPMIMFDPNCGWWEVRNNPTAGGFFKTWLPKWYKGMGYDTDYHGGDRLIYRYT